MDSEPFAFWAVVSMALRLHLSALNREAHHIRHECGLWQPSEGNMQHFDVNMIPCALRHLAESSDTPGREQVPGKWLGAVGSTGMFQIASCLLFKDV